MSRSKRPGEKKTLLKQINVKKHARIKINSLRLQSFDDVPLKQSQKPKNLPCTTLYGRIFCVQHEQHNTWTVRRRKSVFQGGHFPLVRVCFRGQFPRPHRCVQGKTKNFNANLSQANSPAHLLSRCFGHCITGFAMCDACSFVHKLWLVGRSYYLRHFWLCQRHFHSMVSLDRITFKLSEIFCDCISIPTSTQFHDEEN